MRAKGMRPFRFLVCVPRVSIIMCGVCVCFNYPGATV